jgi:hypothetical protein
MTAHGRVWAPRSFAAPGGQINPEWAREAPLVPERHQFKVAKPVNRMPALQLCCDGVRLPGPVGLVAVR